MKPHGQQDPDKDSVDISDYERRRNDGEDRREALKAAAAVVSAVGAILIPAVLAIANYQFQQSSELRNNRQIALQLQSDREKSEAEMKAAMFGKLLDKYQASKREGDPLQKIFFLELLVANFGDSLNLAPIINDLSTEFRRVSSRETVPSPGLTDAYNRVKAAIREAGSRQLSLLSNVGAVIDVQAKPGDEFTVHIRECKDGWSAPANHYLTLHYDSIVNRSGEPAAQFTFFYWDPTWNPLKEQKSKPPIQQSFFVEAIDLPLIDNLPLRDGARLALRSNGEPSANNETGFTLVTFSQEYSSIRDKPTAREYVEFLTKGPIGRGIDRRTSECYQANDPISIALLDRRLLEGSRTAEQVYYKQFIETQMGQGSWRKP